MRFRTRVVCGDLLDSKEGKKKTKKLVETEEREHLIKEQASNINVCCTQRVNKNKKCKENLINL